MSWERIDDKHRLRNPSKRLYQRVYGLHGKMWPRLILTIYDWTKTECHSLGGKDKTLPCFKVGVSYKRSGGDWWEECSIPFELLPELQTLLELFNKAKPCENM